MSSPKAQNVSDYAKNLTPSAIRSLNNAIDQLKKTAPEGFEYDLVLSVMGDVKQPANTEGLEALMEYVFQVHGNRPNGKYNELVKHGLDQMNFADRSPKAVGYGPFQGDEDVRQQLANVDMQRLKDVKVSRVLTANDYVVTNGISGAIELALKTLTNSGDTVLAFEEYFAGYKANIEQNLGRVFDAIPKEDGLTHSERLAKKLDELHAQGKKVTVIGNFPANPDGTVVSQEEARKIIRTTLEKGANYLGDEAYSLIRLNGASFFTTKELLPDDYANLPGIAVELRGATKDFGMAGVRAGHVLTFDRFKNNDGKELSLAEAMGIMQGSSIVHPSRFAQKAYAASYPHWKQAIEDNRVFYEPRVNAVYNVFHAAGLTTTPRPQGAIYVCLDDVSWMIGQKMTPLTAKIFGKKEGELIKTNAEAVIDIGMRTGMVMVPKDSFGGKGARIVATDTPAHLAEGAERVVALKQKVMSQEALPKHPPLRPKVQQTHVERLEPSAPFKKIAPRSAKQVYNHESKEETVERLFQEVLNQNGR